MKIENVVDEYKKLAYPGRKEQRVAFLIEVLAIPIGSVEDAKIVGQVIVDLLSDQIVIYDYFSGEDQDAIYAWVESNWQNDFELSDLFVAIVCNLKYAKSKKFLCEILNRNLSDDIIKLVEKTLMEEYPK